MYEWDNPAPQSARDSMPVYRAQPPQTARHASAPDALVDPLAFIQFLFDHLWKILVLSVILTITGISLFKIIPFPYRATAIILVDPREKGVQVSQDVASEIDGDAAVLESIVELVQSDGFLRPLLAKLNIAADPQFQDAAPLRHGGDERQLLRAFKAGLTALRIGATYIVEVHYTSADPDKSAFYANAIANAFIDNQKNTRLSASVEAANSLSERLSDLRNTLQASEKAIATFRSDNNIVSIDATSTLQQRELIEISQQIAQAKTSTEVARAQYEQIQNGSSGVFNTLGDQAESQQLQLLAQQRNLVSQTLAEFSLTFGPRHPRIAAEQSKLASLDQQIADERQRLVALSKKRLDAAITTQQALENDMETLRQQVTKTETALVKLGELEREAAANRQIYENFLSRFKSADEQQSFQSGQARIASAASPPLYSTRPSIVLASGVIALVSLVLSTVLVLAREGLKGRAQLLQEATATERPRPVATTFAMQPPALRHPPALLPAIIPSPALAPDDDTEPVFTPIARQEIPVPARQAERPAAKPLHPPKPRAATRPAQAEPVIGLPHIDPAVIHDDFDLECTLASQLGKVPDLLQPASASHQGGMVVLVSSWLAHEGKTTIARSLALLGHDCTLDTVLIKTPLNSALDVERGAASHNLARPYAILDPYVEQISGHAVDFSSFSAVQSIIRECRNEFELIVIDASTLTNEPHFNRLSHLADKTFIVFDKPDDRQIEPIAAKTVKANFKQTQMVLNNL